MKKSFLLTALATLSLGAAVQGQTYSDYPWKGEMPASAEIPTAYQSADAVYLNFESYNKGKFSGTYPQLEQLGTYRTKEFVKIQSEKGLKDFNRIVIQKFTGRIADYIQVKHVDIRIRKADGKVVDYDIRKLPKVELKEDDPLYANRKNLEVLEVKDLAVGDELEKIVIIEAKFLRPGEMVNLYKQYPCLEATYKLSIPSTVRLDRRAYNGMEVPTVKKTGGQNIYTWKKNGLKAVPEANSTGTIFAKDLEYFTYALNFDAYRAEQMGIKVKTWGDLMMVYNEDFLTMRAGSKKKLQKFYDEVCQGKTAPLEKVFYFNQYIMKNVQQKGRYKEDQEALSLLFYYENKIADYSTLLCMYKDFFERQGIEYYLAFGKKRFDGPLDFGFVSDAQLHYERFFVFKIGDNLYTLFPAGGINELPWFFSGTRCYMKNIADRGAKIQSIDFPIAVVENTKNKRSVRSQIKVDLAKNSMEQTRTVSLAGNYSRSGRQAWLTGMRADTLTKTLQAGYDYAFRNLEGAKVEVTAANVKQLETIQPYDFKGIATMKMQNFLQEEEGGYSLSLENWLGHSIRYIANADKRVLDYHMPFLGTDKEEYFLIFDKPVNVEGLAALTQKVDNEFVSFNFSVTQMKPNMLRVQSVYKVKKLLVGKDDAPKIKAVNEAVEKAMETVILFKKK